MQKFLKSLDDKLNRRNNLKAGDIRYAGLNIRMLANLFDMILLLMLVTPVMMMLPQPDLSKMQSGLSPEVSEAFELHAKGEMNNQEFIKRLQPTLRNQVIPKLVTAAIVQILIMGVLYMICWKRWNSSPGKMVFGLKIVDGITLGNPTTSQYIIRFIGYIIAALPLCLGFLIIPLTPRKRGLHDYMADTAVIYSRTFDPIREKKKMKWQIYLGIFFLILTIIIFAKKFSL